MATYVYETIPQNEGEEPTLYEFKHSMNEAPLQKHPETGEPLRRVISGGYGMVRKGGAAPASGGGCGCHPGGHCH